MLDLAERWPVIPDWAETVLATDGVSISSARVASQYFVSGNLEGWREFAGTGDSLGALGLATGSAYAVRMARDRLLAVGELPAIEAGWHEKGGFAVTPMGAALHIFEITGARAIELVKRGTTLDLANPGPCAAVGFAGIVSCLYRYQRQDIFRLHADRGLAPYLWFWMNASLRAQGL